MEGAPMPDPSTPDPSTAAQRQRLYRQREAGLAPGGRRIPCENCPRSHTGAHELLCSRCWERLTPEGRMAVAERVFLHRQAKAKRDNL
jgi:hypothetical protein